MAALVDMTLIGGAACAAAAVAATHFDVLPSLKTVELCAVPVLILSGMLYQALFFMFGNATPGMKYAGISLCTFDDQVPSRAQLRSRLSALFLSVLPLGLGVAWAIFDENHLSWHDRLSRTYQRK
jgi:uncharacterized RDD family membrane protein YckC